MHGQQNVKIYPLVLWSLWLMKVTECYIREEQTTHSLSLRVVSAS